MFTSLFGRCIGIFSAVAVLLLFFFPLVTGPFPATHGPATIFRLKWAVLMLLISMLLEAFRVLALRFVEGTLVPFRYSAVRMGIKRNVNPGDRISILRC